MKARSRWEHDPVLTRTLGTVGRLSGGPEERRSEDSIHTQMDSRGGLCSSNPWPYQAQSGSHQTSCVPGACSLQLRSPWAESRRRVEWDPLDSQAIWDGVDAAPKREDQRESTSPEPW